MDAAEAQLVDDILAAPADDQPRLVYADWLAERGDPRGELIQLQCHRRRSAPTPSELQRERELLLTERARLLGPFAAVVPWDSVRFLHGFLDELTIADSDELAAHAADPRLALVRKVTFSGTSARAQEAIVAGLRNVRHVGGLCGGAVAALAAGEQKLPVEELVQSVVAGNPLPDVGRGAAFANLRVLELRATHLAPIALLPLALHPNLERIEVMTSLWIIRIEPTSGNRHVVASPLGRDGYDMLIELLRPMRGQIGRVTIKDAWNASLADDVAARLEAASGALVDVENERGPW